MGYATLGLEWLYPAVYILIIAKFCLSDTERTVSIITAVIICMVYDPRVATVMPDFIGRILEFFSSTCNAYLVTDYHDGVYYTIFDIFMAIACWWGGSIAKYNNEHDIY